MRYRRQRNEGHISRVRRPRKGGGFTEFWIARLSAGYTSDGRRRRLSISGKSKAEVLDGLARLRFDPSTTQADDRKLTLGEYLSRWLEDLVRPSRRSNTHVLYSDRVRLNIVPYIGGTRLSKLMPLHVQGMLAALERDGASQRMRQLTYGVLRTSLNQAVKWNLIPRNPCNAVEPPRASSRVMQVLDEEQVRAFLRVAREDQHGCLYVLALATGMRRGELFGLRWSDIDLDNNSLSVNRTLVELAGKFDVADPKSTKGRRRIDLPPSVVTTLREYRKRMLGENQPASMWVFCDVRGGPLRASNVVRRSFRPLLKRAGLPVIRFHDLRHTAATLMLSQGIHPKIVQERLGHSKIAVTLDIYSHVLPSMQRDVAEKLDRLFCQPPTPTVISEQLEIGQPLAHQGDVAG